MTEKIVDRIKKLLNLGDKARNPNEAEAEAAMAKAHELLAEYNLNLSQLEADSVASGSAVPLDADPERKRKRQHMEGSGQYKYQRTMWEHVARINYCWYWLSSIEFMGRKCQHRHVLLGREENVATVQILCDYFEQAMRRLCPPPPPGAEYKWAVSWKEGCVNRLMQRLWDKRDEQEAAQAKAAAGTKALTLRSLADLEYERNYDSMNGPGAWRREQERAAQREAEWKAEQAARANEPVVLVVEKPLTEKQKAKQAEREARERERAQEARERERNNRWKKRNRAAYYAGIEAADTINLSGQVKN